MTLKIYDKDEQDVGSVDYRLSGDTVVVDSIRVLSKNTGYGQKLLSNIVSKHNPKKITSEGLSREGRQLFKSFAENNGYYFDGNDILMDVLRKKNSELLQEPEHQSLQSSEFEKTDITNEDELSTYPKNRERAYSEIKHIKSVLRLLLGIKYYNSHGYPMTFEHFMEVEVGERKNYTKETVRYWQKKYKIKPSDKVIWVSPDKWVANRYGLPDMGWESLHKIPEGDLSVVEIDSSQGFIIPESDDGEDGFLFVFR